MDASALQRPEKQRQPTAGLRPDFECGGSPPVGRGNDVVVHSLCGPTEQTLVMREPRELGSAPFGEHGDVDRCVKARRRRDSALPNGVHQAQCAKILENTRPSGPWDLAILRSPQRLKYRFVGIRGHLTSFLKCSYDTFVPNASPSHQ